MWYGIHRDSSSQETCSIGYLSTCMSRSTSPSFNSHLFPKASIRGTQPSILQIILVYFPHTELLVSGWFFISPHPTSPICQHFLKISVSSWKCSQEKDIAAVCTVLERSLPVSCPHLHPGDTTREHLVQSYFPIQAMGRRKLLPQCQVGVLK